MSCPAALVATPVIRTVNRGWHANWLNRTATVAHTLPNPRRPRHHTWGDGAHERTGDALREGLIALRQSVAGMATT